jgi:hypothetical protein
MASFDHPSRGNIVVARPYFARQAAKRHPKDAAPAWEDEAGAEVYREKSAAYRHDSDVGSQSADPH